MRPDAVVHDVGELLKELEIDPGPDADLSAEVEDALHTLLGYAGGVSLDATGVELMVGNVGSELAHPFRFAELVELAEELEVN